MTIKQQINIIDRILNSSRLFTCSCGFQCMPMVTKQKMFTCPKCNQQSEV